MFTGLDPHEHAVPRNGFPLSDSVETLAERLSSLGWDTMGVIGASVVDRKMGMAQGFRLFDDSTRTDMGPRTEDRGDRVTRRALALLEKRDPNKPLFAWVHYYDAHSPYEAPAEFTSRFVESNYRPAFASRRASAKLAKRIRSGEVSEKEIQWLRGLYQGEVAWVDYQVERLFGHLESLGLLDNALIVFAGDHGEMFAESRPFPLGHGFDVDTWVSRVPFIFAGTGEVALEPRVVQDSVKLSDLSPTVLGLLGLENTVMGSGRNLVPLLKGEEMAPVPVYLEATKSRAQPEQQGWNNLNNERGIVLDSHILIRHPRLKDQNGLFRLDKKQSRVQDGDREASMYKSLEAWDAKAPPFRKENMDQETIESLKALGYIE